MIGEFYLWNVHHGEPFTSFYLLRNAAMLFTHRITQFVYVI
jgi:hypothetical protein